MSDSFSLARSTWAGTVSDLMSAGPARPFLQPWYEPISTSPSDTGMPLGGIGSAFTVTPAGTTPVLSLIPGLHVTAPPVSGPEKTGKETDGAGQGADRGAMRDATPWALRLHNFFYCEREVPPGLSSQAGMGGPTGLAALPLSFPDFGAFLRSNTSIPLVDSRGRPWFRGDESREEAAAAIRPLIDSPTLHADNASRWDRWKTEWSPRTMRALSAPAMAASRECRLYLLLDFYSGSLGLEPAFAGSLTGNAEEDAIDGYPTYSCGQMHYRALYPRAETRYQGQGHRLAISKITYTPLVPGDERSCSLPVSVVEFTLE